MIWWIGVLVFIMLVGPMLALLPSPRQKEQQRFRKEARLRGMRVELSSIDDPNPDPDEYLSATGQALEPIIRCIAYQVRRVEKDQARKVPPSNWRLVKFSTRQERVGYPGLPKKINTSVKSIGDWSRIDEPGTELHPDLYAFLLDHLPRLPGDVIMVEEQRYTVSVYWRELGGDEALAAVLDFLSAISEVDTPIVDHDETQ